MCICMWIYMYKCTYIGIYTYLDVYMYICIYIYVYIYVYVYVHVHICVCMYICVCTTPSSTSAAPFPSRSMSAHKSCDAGPVSDSSRRICTETLGRQLGNSQQFWLGQTRLDLQRMVRAVQPPPTGWPTMYKLTCRVCGTNSSTLEQKGALSHQIRGRK